MKYLTKKELHKELNHYNWMEMAGGLSKLIYYFDKYKQLQKTIDFENLKWNYEIFDLELRKIIQTKWDARNLSISLKRNEETNNKKRLKI